MKLKNMGLSLKKKQSQKTTCCKSIYMKFIQYANLYCKRADEYLPRNRGGKREDGVMSSDCQCL